MIDRNHKRSVIAGLLAAAFAVASTAATAMSPSEHDYMPREALKRLHGDDRANQQSGESTEESRLIDVGGRVGKVRVPKKADLPDRDI